MLEIIICVLKFKVDKNVEVVNIFRQIYLRLSVVFEWLEADPWNLFNG